MNNINDFNMNDINGFPMNNLNSFPMNNINSFNMNNFNDMLYPEQMLIETVKTISTEIIYKVKHNIIEPQQPQQPQPQQQKQQQKQQKHFQEKLEQYQNVGYSLDDDINIEKDYKKDFFKEIDIKLSQPVKKKKFLIF